MRATAFLLAASFFTLVLAHAAPTQEPEESETGTEQYKSPNSVTTLLESIDTKLNYLEGYAQLQKLNNLDSTLKQIQRKIESIAVRLEDIELKLDAKTQQVEETVVKPYKTLNDQDDIKHKLDALGQKVTNKLNAIDIKLETKLETITRKLDRMSKESDRTATILDSMRADKINLEYATRLSCLEVVHKEKVGLKQYVKEELIRGLDTRLTSLENSVENKMDVLRRSFASRDAPLQSDLTSKQCTCGNQSARTARSGDIPASLPQSYSLNSNAGEEDTKLSLTQFNESLSRALTDQDQSIKELTSKFEVYSRKFVNNFQEVWKHIDETNLKLQQVFESNGRNAKLLENEMAKLVQHLSPIPSLTQAVLELEFSFENQVKEMAAGVNNMFESLQYGQTAFIDNCNRIQQEEALIFSKQQEILKELRNKTERDSEILRSFEEQNQDTDKQINEVKNLILQIGKKMKEKSPAVSAQCFAVGSSEVLKEVCKAIHLPLDSKVVTPKTTDGSRPADQYKF